MTIGTGSVSFSAIQTEFTGANPISLSEYYRGGGTGYVPSGTPNGGFGLIATSGAISVGTFRGTSRAVTINLTISVNTANYNIRTAAGSPAGVATVTVTVNSGIYVYGSTTGVFAMDTGTGWTAGSTISVVNNGLIVGCGGAGGAGATVPNATNNSFGAAVAGGTGGTALRSQYAVAVTNNGTVAGGGGGGGGGGAEKNNTNGKGTAVNGFPGAGGGGGRGGPSTGGAGSSPVGCANSTAAGSGTGGTLLLPTTTTTTIAPGTAGSAGARSVIGSVGSGGGSGYGYGLSGAALATVGQGGPLGTAGFAGGNPALDSAQYYSYGHINGAAGGAAGNYVNGAANTTWPTVGTRLGGAV